MKHIKLFENFSNESHTDRTAIDDLGNESEVKDAVMDALTKEYPAAGDGIMSKDVRNLLGGIMFSHLNKSIEINNEPLEDITELLHGDIHEVAFTIGEAIWKLDPAIVESAGKTEFDLKKFAAMMGFDDDLRNAYYDKLEELGLEEPSIDIYHMMAGEEVPKEQWLAPMRTVFDEMIKGTPREAAYVTAIEDFQKKMTERRNKRMNR